MLAKHVGLHVYSGKLRLRNTWLHCEREVHINTHVHTDTHKSTGREKGREKEKERESRLDQLSAIPTQPTVESHNVFIMRDDSHDG